MIPDFTKQNGLIPVIIQDDLTLQIRMLGYMNEEAYLKTKRDRRVTFFSRSKNRLWTKGEESGNYLGVRSMQLDCDADALLIRVVAEGPTCHTGAFSCFGDQEEKGFIYQLEQVIASRIEHNEDDSYTNSLFKRGINKIAQKVGEEAVELVIEAKDKNDDLFLNEAADLMFHLLLLLRFKEKNFADVERVLLSRHLK